MSQYYGVKPVTSRSDFCYVWRAIRSNSTRSFGLRNPVLVLALYIHVYAIYSYDVHACYPCAMPRHVVGGAGAQYCGFVRMLEQAANDLYLMFSMYSYWGCG